jgi:lipopolysaccharide transport system permease protein
MNTGKTNIPPVKPLPSDTVLPGVEEAAPAGSAEPNESHEFQRDSAAAEGTAQLADELEVRTYSADSELRHPAQLIRAMFHDLWSSRELAWRLFVRDLNAQYRQSLLGYLWVIVPPLASMLIWVFLNKNGIFNIDPPPVPYPVFVITGLVLWEAFVSSLNAPQNAMNSAMGLLTKINFPREALLVSAAGQVVFGISVRLLILVGVYTWFGIVPHATAWLAPLGLLGLMVLGFGMGLLLAPAVMLYQDFSRGLAILTGPWMLLTPVIYPSPKTFPGTLINWLNPVSPLLAGTRELITEGALSHAAAFVGVGLLSVVLFFMAWIFCRISMPHLIARMSS